MNSTEYQQRITKQLMAMDKSLASIGKPQIDAEIWLHTALDAFMRDHAKYDRRAYNRQVSRARRSEAQDIALLLLGLADLAIRDLHRVRVATIKPTLKELAASYHYKNLALLPKDGSLPPHISRN
jgi:hypothetical protein